MATIQTCIKPILSKLSNEELGLIRIILEYGKKSEEKLGKKITDPKVLQEWSQKGSKDSIPGELALHFQEGFGFADAFKGIDSDYGKQLDYVIRKMLVKSLKATKPVFASTADTKKGALEREEWITTKFMDSMWDKFPEEIKKEIAVNIEHILKNKGIAGDKAARAAAGLLAGGLAGARAILGFQFHILLAQLANLIVKTIAGRGLALAGNAALQRIAGMLLGGPYAWIIAGLLLLPTVTGLLMPRDLDKYLPIVFIIGLKRISMNETKKRLKEEFVVIMSSTDRMNEIIEMVLKAIDLLPNPPREIVRKEFMKIKEMMADNRPPRIVMIGRRGAGKSSIINAIFKEKVADVGSVLSKTGEAEWHDFHNEKGSLHILDTRGLGDRTKPESANFAEAIDDIKCEAKTVCPDALLFLCKAKEVDSNITPDIDNVITLWEFISEVHSYDIPVAGLVTQVDELDPLSSITPPYKNQEKQDNIKLAVNALHNAFDKSPIDLLKIVPVSAYAKYDNGNRLDDRYWNIDTLIDYLIEVLPHSAQLQMARLSLLKKTQRKFARTIVRSTAFICGGLAATPIPVADIIPITAAQIGMIMSIAYISGRELSKKSAREFLAAMGVNVGAGFALREGARAIIKFLLPGGGNVVSAGIAIAGTWGLGEAAIAYFIDKVSVEEAKQRFKKAKKKHMDD